MDTAHGWGDTEGPKKMKESARCFILVALLAQAAPAQQALTLEECLAEAARQHPDLRAAQAALEKADYDYRARWSQRLPQLSAYGNRTRAHREAEAPDASGGSDFYSVGVSARQTWYAGGRLVAEAEQARAERQRAALELQATLAEVSYEVVVAFANLLYAQEQVQLAEAIAKRRAENLEMIELRYESGKEHRGSLLRMQAAHRAAEAALSSARRGLEIARRRLARAIGGVQNDALTVAGRLEADPPPVTAPDFETLTQEALEVRLAQAAVRAARAAARSVRSGYYPEVTAEAEAGRSAESWPPDEEAWSVGVSVSYPFFPGGRNIFEARGAAAEIRRAEAAAESRQTECRVALQEAFARYQDAFEQVQVQAQYLEAAELRADIARTQYTGGLLSFEDWDLIENDLIEREKALLTCRRDAVLAQAAWERAQGRHRFAVRTDPAAP